MQEQELQVAGAELAGGAEIVAATPSMAPMPAKEASTMTVTAAATMSADAIAPAPTLLFFFVKSHFMSFVCLQ